MNKSLITILGILSILVIVVAVSGCTNSGNNISTFTTTQKVLAEYNITTTFSNPVTDTYVTLPNGVKSITIEYNNLTASYDPISQSYNGFFQFSSYNVDVQQGQVSTNLGETLFLSMETVELPNPIPLTGSVTLEAKGAKSVGIRASQAKGNVKVLITT
jgi:hypothetical protein